MASIYFISLVAYGMHPVFTVVGTIIFWVQCLGAGRNVALMVACLLPVTTLMRNWWWIMNLMNCPNFWDRLSPRVRNFWAGEWDVPLPYLLLVIMFPSSLWPSLHSTMITQSSFMLDECTIWTLLTFERPESLNWLSVSGNSWAMDYSPMISQLMVSHFFVHGFNK